MTASPGPRMLEPGDAMYDCVIAAAGGSSRMGSPKQLLPFGGPEGGLTMVASVAAAALGAGCRVILVVGCRGAEVAKAARLALAASPGELVVVDNPAWEEGMLGSIQAGLGAARGEAFFSMNADMPLAPACAYLALAAAREARKREGLPEAAFFASHRGEAGHPVLVPSAWIPAILELPRSGRMKAFLENRPSVLVEAGSTAVLDDIDTPEDYERACAGAASPRR